MKLSELAAQCAATIMENGDGEISYVELLSDDYRASNHARIVLEDRNSYSGYAGVVFIEDNRGRK